jgi:glucose/mannose-6-phosphate isomerase
MKLPATIDPEDMGNLVDHFPELLNIVHLQKNIIALCKEYQDDGVSGICFLGMGGSSIAGNYVKALLDNSSKIPISIVRDYTLPTSIDGDWIVIAVSYSGNTEETLSGLKQAKERGCKVFRITSGGKMGEENLGQMIPLQKGLQPRATLPLILSAVLSITENLIDLHQTDFEKLASTVSGLNSSWRKWEKTPKEMADDLLGKIPIFIGANHLRPVAYRAKCQINENAKALAFYSEIPEANHNEIEGFYDTYGCKVIPIFLRSGYESTRIARRLDITYDLYQEMDLSPVKIQPQGHSILEEMMTLTHYLDSISVELAHLRNVNPVSVEKIQDLKHRLSRD